MPRLVLFPALVGMLLLVPQASHAQISGQIPPPPAVPHHVHAATTAPCGHVHAGGHGPCSSVPCATFLKPDTRPLPPITLSRYADNGDYDCTRRVYGDAHPHFPRYWFNGQPYALPHDSKSRASQGGGGDGDDDGNGNGGPSGGRGVGVGGRGGASSEEMRGPSGGRGVGVGVGVGGR